MKHIATTIAALAVAVIGAMSSAHAAADKAMSYAELKKVIGQTQGDVAKTTPLVVGKTLAVTLKSSNDALFVDSKDGVYFTCESRGKSFKGGKVTSKVSKYGLTPDGDVSVTLATCGS